MKRHLRIDYLSERVKERIFSDELKSECVMRQQDFSRNRKLSFADYLLIILRNSKRCLQIAVNDFLRDVRNEKVEYTKQAYSKGRMRIKPEAILSIFQETVDALCADERNRFFNGYRVTAIDGTDYDLPNTPELLAEYGSEKFQGKHQSKQQVQAHGSCLYDVLNGILLDVVLSRFDKNERTQAEEHLAALAEMRTDKELIVLDRGYPSRELIRLIESYGFKYLMRSNKNNFFREVRDANEPDQWAVRSESGEDDLRFRVVNVVVKGTEETLLTNLSEEEFSKEELTELYHLRWGIETFYDDIKNKMEIENFSGVSKTAILQDFYATMALSNFVTAAELDAQDDVDCKNATKELKYEYKINRSMAIHEVKNELYMLLLEPSPRKTRRRIKKLVNTLAKNVVPIRPDRAFERERKHPSMRFPMNGKSVD